jgi:hypothetical protein
MHAFLEQDRSRFSPLPQDFAEEARQAADRKDVAHLGLLAAEAAGFSWEMEGWRTLGKMLVDLGAWPAARRTFERVLHVDTSDLDANLWLGTVYQRLDQLEMFALPTAAPPLEHVVVFTGHMIDSPGRSKPRFPESCADAARQQIRERLLALEPALGIAAAASGGDTLFHEVCAELGIRTDVCLVMPPQLFVNESVASAGQGWVERFWSIVNASQSENRFTQLGNSGELPGWLRRKAKYSIWNRANLWMLEYALSKTPGRLTVMALWNGEAGDGPGGTADLLETATALGATPSVIKTDVITGS